MRHRHHSLRPEKGASCKKHLRTLLGQYHVFLMIIGIYAIDLHHNSHDGKTGGVTGVWPWFVLHTHFCHTIEYTWVQG
jgi:hypothetical protein